MPNILPAGIGESLGDSLAINGPLYLSGKVWYVNSVTGADSAAPRGLSPEYPLATLNQAITNASVADIVVLMDGHTESIGGTLTITKQLKVIGGGYADGKPTAKLKLSADAIMLQIQAVHFELRNIWFEEPTVAQTNPTIRVEAEQFRMIDCYVECNEQHVDSAAHAVQLFTGANKARIEGTTFISTATDKTNRPVSGLYSGSLNNHELYENVFDGGTVGWATFALEFAGSVARFAAEGNSLLRGSDVSIASGSTGHFLPGTVTGGSRVEWA